jgi:hypothetical protein
MIFMLGLQKYVLKLSERNQDSEDSPSSLQSLQMDSSTLQTKALRPRAGVFSSISLSSFSMG